MGKKTRTSDIASENANAARNAVQDTDFVIHASQLTHASILARTAARPGRTAASGRSPRLTLHLPNEQ